MKKAIALAMASVMAAGLLAGCGGSAANSTAASSEAASSEAASTSTEAATEAHTINTTDPITLTISWWGGDARQAAYEAACKAFTEKYPNITVECTYGPWNGWEEAQSTALAAGNAADVMQVNWNWLFQYSGKGQSFVNLNDYSDVLDLTQSPLTLWMPALWLIPCRLFPSLWPAVFTTGTWQPSRRLAWTTTPLLSRSCWTLPRPSRKSWAMTTIRWLPPRWTA